MRQFRPYLLATVSSSIVLTGTAVAPWPAMAQPFTWTGFYVGLNVGAGSNRADFDQSPDGLAFYFPGGPNYWNSSDWGAAAGALAGYNWQSDNFVFGLEGDINWLNGRDNATEGTVATSTAMNWYGTARARIGLSNNSPLMVFLTGGVAVAEISNSARLTFRPQSYTSSDVRLAPVVGVGFEYKLAQNTTFRIEGLFADFGDTSRRILDGGNYKTTFSNTLSVVRGAVTWAW